MATTNKAQVKSNQILFMFKKIIDILLLIIIGLLAIHIYFDYMMFMELSHYHKLHSTLYITKLRNDTTRSNIYNSITIKKPNNGQQIKH